MEGVPPDAWKWEVDRTSGPGREPGPINLQRYALVPAYAGIATLLSLDIDVLDPAFAPGTGTPEPPGLTNRELLPALRRICHETPVVGMDIVEVAPHLDPGYTTTMNARRAIFEALTGIAMRRKGLPGPAYVDPDVGGPPPA
ncbi:arginase family protein [Streptomyces sioyaensis]|uniref:arginase family protein n=1 Tax=Streptomyces sioyaensis TaxID=67364 RepID=UPI0037B22BFA